MQPRAVWSLTLLVLIGASLLLPCFDFCADDEEGESCPPVCAACLGCPRTSAVDTPRAIAVDSTLPSERATVVTRDRALPLLADEILHVPLARAA